MLLAILEQCIALVTTKGIQAGWHIPLMHYKMQIILKTGISELQRVEIGL